MPLEALSGPLGARVEQPLEQGQAQEPIGPERRGISRRFRADFDDSFMFLRRFAGLLGLLDAWDNFVRWLLGAQNGPQKLPKN